MRRTMPGRHCGPPTRAGSVRHIRTADLSPGTRGYPTVVPQNLPPVGAISGSANAAILRPPRGHQRQLQQPETSISRARSLMGWRWPATPMPPAALVCRGCQYRLIDVEAGQLALEVGNLRQIVVDDIGVARISDQEILVVAFRRIETLERIHARDDRVTEHMRLLQLGDVGQR